MTLLCLTACVPVAPSPAPPTGISSPQSPDAGTFTAGADGVGDALYPRAGNGGIDVEHYDLQISYDPPPNPSTSLTGRLEGRAVLRIRATENLERFNLDLRELTAARVAIDGEVARFTQDEGELVIVAAAPMSAGETFEVQIDYAGDKTVSDAGPDGGFYPTADGGVSINEPHGAPEWFPSNDHPTDKASYRFAVSVPEGTAALSNGILLDDRTAGGRTTWVWDAPDPMSSYLALLAIGEFEIRRSSAPDGTPIIDAIGAGVDPESYSAMDLTGEMMAYFEDTFGEYPFVAYGQVVDNDRGTALETQTRSIFGNGTTTELTVAHELAHQWFGDWVSPGRWSDLWLNEGWALYAEWMWDEHHNGVPVQATVDRVLLTGADAPEWQGLTAAPERDDLFSWAVYQRGALSLHALRSLIGDDAFLALAREWLSRYGGSTATTEDFVALAEEISGRDLSVQFQEWVYEPGRPADW
ncbi:M1 family metallopeptidase [Microbacterium sp. CPCC 204701]|uniref:M1 family metallopeptidase n=1 Tax=Microbacterium sp. CPCC 204701 TaxID=2493084 RepID=UPI000FD7F9F5|nr:M1 family metallopeptidase [Microbacterium sp. CPCC 204701]